MPAEILGKHYAGLFNEVSAAVFVVLPTTGQVVSVNLEAEELTGYEKSELERMEFWSIFRTEDRQRIHSIIARNAHTAFQKLYEHNVIIQKRSKRPIYVDMGFRMSRIMNHDVFIFTLQDITDIKMHERQAVEAHRALANIFQSVREILLVIDADGTITSANPATTTLLRWGDAALEGVNAGALFWDAADFTRAMAAIQAKNYLPESEFAWRAADGTRVPVLLSASLLDEAGDHSRARYVLAAMDLTERHKAEKVIAEQQMIIVQAAKMSELGQMASSIAHEINNPLQIISGRCEMLGMFVTHDPIPLNDLKESLGVIDGMSSRIKRIVQGLQALARDASQDPMISVPLQQVLTDALSLCEQRLRKKGIALSLPSFRGEWVLSCQPTMLAQVFLNLLNNAHDALARTPSPRITIEVVTTEEAMTIVVTNNGPAIPAAIADKIFLPFFTTKPVGKGTGIGLSVSRSIVASHGGSLSLDTSSEHPRFLIQLPYRQPQKQAAAS